jgi:hypothetical protein
VGLISTIALLGTISLLLFTTIHPDEIIILLSVTSTGIGILGGILTASKTKNNEELSCQMNQQPTQEQKLKE